MATEYHVSPDGNDCDCGDAENPFRTISRAARVAVPGDTVTVHAGVYREWVDPARGGLSDSERITYQSAKNEPRPVITGSERIRCWKPVDGHPGVWEAVVKNDMFGDFNPFEERIFGDWLESPKQGKEPDKHVGDVYLNGRSLYEAVTIDDTYNPSLRESDEDYALRIPVDIADPEWTQYVWHARVDERSGETTIWANFHDYDPNRESVEISVRRACFFPRRNHIDYITVRGFEICNAAGDWAPPTSAQWGMLGPNWSYGWIVEDNVLHDAKFSAVSLGKEISTGDNEWARTERKTGYQYQLETVFKALRIGWRRGLVGSHIVRNNEIYNCGQNGIVGHMGCAFSRIEHNHVHHIANKREFFGWEVAGIKFHAALDTMIEHNYVHDCSLGLWFDWQTQGTRLTRNVFARNIRDLMIEVSHGPYLVDDNVFSSPIMLQNWSQGGAFVNNTICGAIEPHTVPDRSTPYHYPHSTDVAGCAVVSGGDERWLNNLFAPQPVVPAVGRYGLALYSEHPSCFKEYLRRQHDMWADPSQGGGERNPLQPVYESCNVYAEGSYGANMAYMERADDVARACADGPFFCGVESCGESVDAPVPVTVEEREDGVHLLIDLPEEIAGLHAPVINSSMLGVPRIVEQRYGTPSGDDYVLEFDLRGERCEVVRQPGALEGLHAGVNDLMVWEWNHLGRILPKGENK